MSVIYIPFLFSYRLLTLPILLFAQCLNCDQSLSWVLEMTCYGPSSQGAYGPVLGRGGARGGRHLSICLSFPLTNSPWGLAVCLALGWGGGVGKRESCRSYGTKE